MKNRKRQELPPEVKKVVEDKNILAMGMAVLGLFVLLGPSSPPAWIKDMPPIGGRKNGAWRGRGSFGKGFGPHRVRHR